MTGGNYIATVNGRKVQVTLMAPIPDEESEYSPASEISLKFHEAPHSLSEGLEKLDAFLKSNPNTKATFEKYFMSTVTEDGYRWEVVYENSAMQGHTHTVDVYANKGGGDECRLESQNPLQVFLSFPLK